MRTRTLTVLLLASYTSVAAAQSVDRSFLGDLLCILRRDSSGIRASIAAQQFDIRDTVHATDIGELFVREASLHFYGPRRTFSSLSLKLKSPEMEIQLTDSQVVERAKFMFRWLDERAPYSIDDSSTRINPEPSGNLIQATATIHGYPFQRKLTCRFDRKSGDIVQVLIGLLPTIVRIPSLVKTPQQAEHCAIEYLTGVAASGTFSALLTRGPRWCSLRSALSLLQGDVRNMPASELESARQNEAFLCYVVTLNDGCEPPNQWDAFVDAESGRVLYAGRNSSK